MNSLFVRLPFHPTDGADADPTFVKHDPAGQTQSEIPVGQLLRCDCPSPHLML